AMTDDAAISASDSSASQKGKFYLIQPDIRGGGKGHGLEIANEERLCPPGVGRDAAARRDSRPVSRDAAPGPCAEPGWHAPGSGRPWRHLDRVRTGQAGVRVGRSGRVRVRGL